MGTGNAWAGQSKEKPSSSGTSKEKILDADENVGAL